VSDLKQTPLYEEHVRLNAKLVPFAGFAMPVQYPTGIRAEHQVVREQVGMFDVSHMGEFRVRGADALAFVSHLTTNDPAALVHGQVQYSVFCHPDGGIVDDLLVYRLADDDFRLVVNGANIDKDWTHVMSYAAGFDMELVDESDAIGLIALQGPRAEQVLAPMTPVALNEIGFYHFTEGEVAGIPCMVSRTGYTGEAGFELYLAAEHTAHAWRALEAEGEPHGLLPTGLGARDTLRLEVGYALYGNDIDDTTSPLEAGLGWLVKLNKGEFVGRDALQKQKDEGLRRRLKGFRLTERGFPRQHYEVLFRGEPSGEVRSGTLSPSLGYGIGTAYLAADAAVGEAVHVVIRDKHISGEVCGFPFYTEGSLKR
jgi:aminomethyltransferase